MQIVCPKCQFAREIPDDKVPANAKVATCPKCKIKFQFRDLPEESHAPSPPAAPPKPSQDPLLPGSKQYVASTTAPRRVAAQGSDDIWKRLEAMPPESTPPAFDPDTLVDDSADALRAHTPPATPKKTAPTPPPPQIPQDEAVDTSGSAPPATPSSSPRMVPNPLEDSHPHSAEAGQAHPRPGEPAFMRFTKARPAAPGGGGTGFAQPSYLRDKVGRGQHTGEVPWEQMKQYGGFFKATLKTIRQVMLSPNAFFTAMPVQGGISKPLGFAMLLGFVGTLFGALYQLLFMQGLTSMAGMEEMGSMPPEFAQLMGAGTLVAVIASPIMIAMMLFIMSFVVNLCMRVLKAAPNGFEGTFRVFSYAGASYILILIPFLGSLLYFFWWLVIVVVGLRQAQETTTGKAILGLILTFIVSMLVVLAPFLLLGMGAAFLAGGASGP